jgi:hypothetical protein
MDVAHPLQERSFLTLFLSQWPKDNCTQRRVKCKLSEGRKAKRVKRDNVELLDHRDQLEEPEKTAPRDRRDREEKRVLKDAKE